jgi:hypothetical protein
MSLLLSLFFPFLSSSLSLSLFTLSSSLSLSHFTLSSSSLSLSPFTLSSSSLSLSLLLPLSLYHILLSRVFSLGKQISAGKRKKYPKRRNKMVSGEKRKETHKCELTWREKRRRRKRLGWFCNFFILLFSAMTLL